MIRSYISRKWVSEDTHSSGYIMYFHNLESLNDEYLSFCRIADCSRSVVFSFKGLPQHRKFKFLNNLVLLCSKKINYFKFQGLILRLFDSEALSYLVIYKRDASTNTTKSLVRLHFDKETCSRSQWESKLSILTQETLNFKAFLETLHLSYED